MIDKTPVATNLKLPFKHMVLINELRRKGFDVNSTGPKKKTVRIAFNGLPVAYINDTIINRDDYVGVTSFPFGGKTDSFPGEKNDAITRVAEAYKCNPSCLDIHYGTGSNSGRMFLGINDFSTTVTAMEYPKQKGNFYG